MKYFRIIDTYDNKEIYIIRTNLTAKELRRKFKELTKDGECGYDDAIKNLDVEIIEISEEIYI